MGSTSTLKSFRRLAVLVLFVVASFAMSFGTFITPTKAAGFTMQTGYYVGDGALNRDITGLGFKPELLIIKSSANTEARFKTSSMGETESAIFGASSALLTNEILFTLNGFTVSNVSGNGVNVAQAIYTWTAFSGSDCTATGTFCVDKYTGDGTGSRVINSVFTSDFLTIKTPAAAANFRTSLLAVTTGLYFNTTARNTAGTLYTGASPSVATVGSINNTNGSVFHYFMFSKASGVMNTGTFVGNATADRDITGVGFKSNLLLIKNATSGTAANRPALMTADSQPTNYSSQIATTSAVVTNGVTQFDTDGFRVGANVIVNESTQTIAWVAFAGVPPANTSGTFKMQTGTYTGSGAAHSISGLGFSPDVVVIKSNQTTNMVFKTRLMKGDTTAYMAVATAAFTGGVTSLDADGFSLGTSANLNTSAAVYEWQAFGNAYNPETKTGASDFVIGSYVGNAINGTKTRDAPSQLDFVATRGGSNIGAFRTSSQPDGTGGVFSTGSEGTTYVQRFDTTGFQLGNNAAANGSGIKYDWFGFKSGPNFKVGNYTGDGTASRAITIGDGMQPDLLWIKKSNGSDGVTRPNTLSGTANQHFGATANATGLILGLTSTGATISGNFLVNQASTDFRTVAWRIPVNTGYLGASIVTASGDDVTSPGVSMTPISFPLTCVESTGMLGAASQRVRITNTTSSATWTTSIAATDGPTALWRNSGNTQQYDFNESSGSPAGCTDGSDADAKAGTLRLEPATATISPKNGCTTASIQLGGNTSFDQSTANNITLATAAAGAGTGCYWDITGIVLKQMIPAGQESNTYMLELTITTVAS